MYMNCLIGRAVHQMVYSVLHSRRAPVTTASGF